MKLDLSLRAPKAILFGPGVRGRIGEHARALGRRAFLVTGGRSLGESGELARIESDLRQRGMSHEPFSVSGEPDVTVVDEGARRCVTAKCEVVLAVGGGSVLDVAKAVAALATNGGAAIDYLPDLGSNRGLERAVERSPLPFIAVPTTAGSGSEVTKNSVLRVPEAAVKRSMRSDLMIPAVAIVDPELSCGAPPGVTVPAALDALTHLLEGYVSRGSLPATDALALEGMKRSVAALQEVADGGSYATQVDELALASLWGGVVLANAGLGAVHGLVAPLGGRFPVPHGCGCGALLGPTFRANVAALREREATGLALRKYRDVADLIAGPTNSLEEAADTLDRLRSRLGAQPLVHYGVTEDALAQIVAGARGGSMKSNPIVLTDAELESILRASLRG